MQNQNAKNMCKALVSTMTTVLRYNIVLQNDTGYMNEISVQVIRIGQGIMAINLIHIFGGTIMILSEKQKLQLCPDRALHSSHLPPH